MLIYLPGENKISFPRLETLITEKKLNTSFKCVEI